MQTRHAEDSARVLSLLESDTARRERAIEISSDFEYSFETIVELVCRTFDTI